MFIKPVLAALTLSCSFIAQADLQNIGNFSAEGIYQPGYTNYSHARERSRNTASTQLSINHQAKTGVIEPNYVNYPIETRAHRTASTNDQLSKIGSYNNGVYEPGYLNHQHIRN
ncbi:hypothetical protein L4D00_13105 [Photobacterium swingsii]|uniref:Uncharacterized protein n=1 Tax=Photobacterium swingsii TaxID=680026 RepID=A0A0J8VHA3_9GAMM|nr:hypothetical protein [Photobacterium swingsii]KMV31860.1 hypothetical protein AB733_03660 [Photobacterium swingsii]PSW25493.1 hypothetical protein C9I94_07575 [Photobacterium swingsii]